MKIESKDFRVPERRDVDLQKWPTAMEHVYESKKHYKRLLAEHVAQLSSLQQLLYASNRHALLLIFQAMDAAGKDGAIKHVMSGVNPQGCQVFSFKHPSADGIAARFSLAHHPRSARTRAHRHLQPLLLRGGPDRPRASAKFFASEGLPDDSARRESALARPLSFHRGSGETSARNGTRIVKFFLHLSKEEQRKRFLERIDDPEKNWKFSLADIEERKFWKHYMDGL